jgi:hypothetical protein
MPDSTHNHADRSSDTRRQAPSRANARRGPVAATPNLTQMSVAVDNPQIATAADILVLQQRYGNQAVNRLIQRANGDDGDQPQSTTSSPGFDLNTARGLYKHLARLYHPDKARNESEVAWRSELMSKINGAAGDLATLKRLQAEGERHMGTAPTTTPTTTPTTPPTTPTTTSTTEPSTELVLAPTTTPAPENSLVVLDNSSSQALMQLVTTNPEPTTEGTPAPGGTNVPNIRMQLVAHKEPLRPYLKKWMADLHASSNYNFYFDTRGNKTLYNTYIVGGAPQPVQLSPEIKNKLDELATARDWAGMGPIMDQARTDNQQTINTRYLQGFQQTPEYKKVMAARDQSPLSRLAGSLAGAMRGARREAPAFGPQLPRQMQQTRRLVTTLEQAIDRYTRYFEQGKQNIAATGLPENPAARQRLLREGQQRHGRVVSAFTRRYTADPTFRKDRYAAFFTRLSGFTKVWTEYKALFER